VPDSASALAVGPVKPIINQARSEPGLVCILCHTYGKFFRKRTFCLCSCIEKLRGTHIILEMFSLQFPIISQDNVAANRHTYQHQVNSGPRSDLDYLGHYKKPRLRLKHSLLVVCC